MGKRAVTLKPNAVYRACPKCGNNTAFTIHAERVAEDLCEVWASCRCGYDPTAENRDRIEDVWGSLDNDTASFALSATWNYQIERQTP